MAVSVHLVQSFMWSIKCIVAHVPANFQRADLIHYMTHICKEIKQVLVGDIMIKRCRYSLIDVDYDNWSNISRCAEIIE